MFLVLHISGVYLGNSGQGLMGRQFNRVGVGIADLEGQLAGRHMNNHSTYLPLLYFAAQVLHHDTTVRVSCRLGDPGTDHGLCLGHQ